jgi:hypothetical protein
MSNHAWIHIGFGIQIDATPIQLGRIVCKLLLPLSRILALNLRTIASALTDDSA